jgi:hypothetical protein
MALKSRSLARSKSLDGVVARTIDIGAACSMSGLSLSTILQAVVSGVLGCASFHSGLALSSLCATTCRPSSDGVD